MRESWILPGIHLWKHAGPITQTFTALTHIGFTFTQLVTSNIVFFVGYVCCSQGSSLFSSYVNGWIKMRWQNFLFGNGVVTSKFDLPSENWFWDRLLRADVLSEAIKFFSHLASDRRFSMNEDVSQALLHVCCAFELIRSMFACKDTCPSLHFSLASFIAGFVFLLEPFSACSNQAEVFQAPPLL